VTQDPTAHPGAGSNLAVTAWLVAGRLRREYEQAAVLRTDAGQELVQGQRTAPRQARRAGLCHGRGSGGQGVNPGNGASLPIFRRLPSVV
jgi:hypothetical protein